MRFVLPQGKSLYAKVLKPDTRFNADGVYSISVVFNQEIIKPVITQLQKLLDDFVEEKAQEFMNAGKPQLAQKVKESKKPVFEYDYDAQGNKTGDIILKVSQSAKRKDKLGATYDAYLPVVDANLQPIEDKNLVIGNGSQVKVSVFAKPYYVASSGAGIKLYLNGVQVIELKKFESNRSVDYSKLGFIVEDGFKSSDTPSKDLNTEEDNPFNF